MIYASFRMRFIATLIDYFILCSIGVFLLDIITVIASFFSSPLIVFDILEMVLDILYSLFILFYYTYFYGSQFMATPGKMLVGIGVCQMDGGRLTYRESLFRFLVEMFLTISGILRLIDIATIHYNQNNRSIHDFIAGTVVCVKPAGKLLVKLYSLLAIIVFIGLFSLWFTPKEILENVEQPHEISTQTPPAVQNIPAQLTKEQKLFRKYLELAESGDPQAQYYVAYIYSKTNKEGGRDKMMYWLNEAAKQGHEMAIKERNRLQGNN